MKKKWALMLALSLVVAAAPAAAAKKKEGNKPGVVMTEVVVIKASVEVVDHENRLLTLKGPEGNVVTVRVGEEVRNFHQIKTGDEIVAEYFDSIAVYVEKSGRKPAAGELDMVEVAPLGEKPAGIAVSTSEVKALVKDIDHKKRTVTLQGPEGRSVSLKVDKGVKNFDRVKKGDEVVVVHTEAVAIAVREP